MKRMKNHKTQFFEAFPENLKALTYMIFHTYLLFHNHSISLK